MARGLTLLVAVMIAAAATLGSHGVGLRYAFAVTPGEQLDDPRLEERARALSLELRCVVCQNQSIDDSDAPLAADLRRVVRERLLAGDSDADVMSFVTDRYGEFVLLRPRFGLHTALLWATPALLLALTGFVIVRARRRQGEAATTERGTVQLSEAEEARLAELLDHKSTDRAAP
ncbi:MAG: cytochrome c-type biogenesis protein [Pseudomonadota bacterium]